MGELPGPDGSDDRVTVTQAELLALREENARLRDLLGLDGRTTEAPTQAWTPTLFTAGQATPPRATVDQSSPPAVKVALFRALFAGREDVYAQRWDNDRTGKGGWGPAVRGGWSNARRPDREYLPYTDEVDSAAATISRRTRSASARGPRTLRVV